MRNMLVKNISHSISSKEIYIPDMPCRIDPQVIPCSKFKSWRTTKAGFGQKEAVEKILTNNKKFTLITGSGKSLIAIATALLWTEYYGGKALDDGMVTI